MACRERKWRTKEANRASFDRSIALNPFSLSGLHPHKKKKKKKKRWKAAQAGGDAAAEAVSSLSIGDGPSASTAEGEAAGAAAAAAAAAPSTSGTAAASDAPPSTTDAAAAPKKKKASKAEPALVLELSSRGKKKSVTTISGLDLFGVKLPEAGKLLGKKFACGASVTKTAEAGKEQVEVQGDVVARAAELLVEQYGKGEGVPGFPLLTKGAVYSVVSKKKERVFPDA